MNSVFQSRTGVALLRPCPFGPPLRGRAPQRDAGTRSASPAGHHPRPAATSASAPLGHGPHQPTGSVL